METRARYALIGLFMLAVILASFAFVYWLENKGGFGKRTSIKCDSRARCPAWKSVPRCCSTASASAT